MATRTGSAGRSAAVAVRDPLRGLGQFYRMAADVAVGVVRTRFQIQEFLEQSWMIARVSIVPTVLVAVPFTVGTSTDRRSSTPPPPGRSR
ncbi:hypothetical protein GCM10023094_16330 [Rhodococcus olei]|uniref:Uncharacterized protein n=1 Tax=Rhodococcus olei TaxID=2161675 RepID=A0ABP8NWV9_9NOCA